MKSDSNSNDQSFSAIPWGEVFLPPLIAAVMTVGLFFWNSWAGIFGIVATVFFAVNGYYREKKAAEQTKNAIEHLDLQFNEVTKNAVFGMPFSMAVLSERGEFLWYNSNLKDLFHIESSYLGHSYQEVFPDMPLESLLQNGSEPFSITVENRIFLFYHNVTDSKPGERLILIYGIDNTDDETVRNQAQAERMVAAVILLDNYDDVRVKIAEQDRPILFAQIDRIVNRYAQDYAALLVKFESDRYLMIMAQEGLERAKKEKFRLFEEIRLAGEGLDITPTVSMGVAYGQETPNDLYNDSLQALDVAMARGGDQVVLKSGEELEYFGGKSQATQRFSRVKARVMSHTISNFIQTASKVLIMGHQNGDMDSFGSCLGMLSFCDMLHARSYIVLEEISPSIENLYRKVIEKLPDAKQRILSPKEAERQRDAGTLIIVLDNHRHDSTAAPELLDFGNRILIIDHHRRGRDYIKQAEVAYIEPSASSASELVTEMIEYLGDDVILPQVVAEGLLAGITVDTKNFFYQTGTRTFEAAAYLKRMGADSVVIRQLFKDDLELMRYRAEIITSAHIFDHNTMIGRFEHDIDGSTLIASQAADDLLGIRGVEASFVLTKSHEKIHISARSLGEISVQLIMEKLGGGGHLTAAATQLEMSMDEASEKLEEAIRNYFKEESDESHSA